jgi:hypothetical protein
MWRLSWLQRCPDRSRAFGRFGTGHDIHIQYMIIVQQYRYGLRRASPL